MAEQEKPFKFIEVVDSRTNQVCKVACMSCIRGHRTTSCGTQVCRNKIFWTVKRPGRPSITCTCRYSSTGGCKCMTAITKCPHKAKKGEKRSSECRCDEQARFCCLLEPVHWNALLALQNPIVEFFVSRDALESGQHQNPATVHTPMTMMSTPTYLTDTPSQAGSSCSTPTPSVHHQRNSTSIALSPYDQTMAPQSNSITPRLGLMDIGKQIGDIPIPADFLDWNERQMVPLDYNPPSPFPPHVMEEESSCCQNSSLAPIQQPFDVMDPFQQPFDVMNPFQQPFDASILDTPSFDAFPPPSADPVFDFERWNQNFLEYQMPGAICQKCGLNGCTCRNCPPVMQNFGTTSWAQCCGRKHARTNPPAPAPQPQQPMAMTQSQPEPQYLPQAQQQPMAMMQSQPEPQYLPQAQQQHMSEAPARTGLTPEQMALEFMQSDIHRMASQPELEGFDPDLVMPDGTDPVDFSAFIMSEQDRLGHMPDEGGYG